jgi:hypothetical protein
MLPLSQEHDPRGQYPKKILVALIETRRSDEGELSDNVGCSQGRSSSIRDRRGVDSEDETWAFWREPAGFSIEQYVAF